MTKKIIIIEITLNDDVDIEKYLSKFEDLQIDDAYFNDISSVRVEGTVDGRYVLGGDNVD